MRRSHDPSAMLQMLFTINITALLYYYPPLLQDRPWHRQGNRGGEEEGTTLDVIGWHGAAVWLINTCTVTCGEILILDGFWNHVHYQPGFAQLVSEQRLCVVKAAPCDITRVMEITADYRTGFTDKMRIKYHMQHIVQP